jgi:hypothetical protein
MTLAQVKRRIIELSRPIGGNLNPMFPFYPPVVWNGLGARVCAASAAKRTDGLDMFNSGNRSQPILKARQDLPLGCSINPTGTTTTVNNPREGPTFAFTSGPTPGPTCAGGAGGSGCGTLCNSNSGFCSTLGPNPANPDFFDPLDPRSPQNPSNPDYTPPVTNIPNPTTTLTTSLPPTTTVLPPTSAPPTGPRQLVAIYLDTLISELANQNWWVFLDVDTDSAGQPCERDKNPNYIEDVDNDLPVGEQNFPVKEYSIQTHDLTCTYRPGPNAKTLGTLDCPGKQVTCDPRGPTEFDCETISNFREEDTWVAICGWFDS